MTNLPEFDEPVEWLVEVEVAGVATNSASPSQSKESGTICDPSRGSSYSSRSRMMLMAASMSGSIFATGSL
jgi:hypothetical protein